MTAGLRERLAAGATLVADGAMGTLLQKRGLPPGACPESLNLERPGLLEEVARLYCEAGADIVQTNTFGGSPLRLARSGLDDLAAEINEAAVAAARRAVGDRALVAGSCGPCGELLRPYGTADPGAVRAGFVLQMRALADAGADLLVVETMTDLAEALLAVAAAREAAPGLPVAATLTFDATPRGYFTVMGQDVATVVRALDDAGADVVGSNCGNGSEGMVRVAREMRRHTDLPLLVQPNAGLPELSRGRVVYRETPEFMAEQAARLLDAGVAIVGGCCGTTPAHVRALRELVDGRTRRGDGPPEGRTP